MALLNLKKFSLRDLLLKREILVLLIWVIIVIFCGLFNRDFISPGNLLGILSASLILIMLSVAETFVITTGGIDVSVGATMGLCCVCMGVVSNINATASFFVAIAVGILAGAFNGLGIAVIGISPIIMTLGSMGIYRGLMPVITGGGWVDSVPQTIKRLAQIRMGQVHLLTILVALIIAALIIVLKFWHPARHLYAVGGNEEGASNLGIRVKRVKFLSFVLSGFFCSLAAIIFVSQLSFVPMNAGSGEEMRAVAASVLGGVSLAGGVGSPLSSAIGAIFLTTINSVLVFLKVSAYWNDAIAGLILIVIVLSDYRIRKYLEDIMKRHRFSSTMPESKA